MRARLSGGDGARQSPDARDAGHFIHALLMKKSLRAIVLPLRS
jgi:hypothetical protein